MHRRLELQVVLQLAAGPEGELAIAVLAAIVRGVAKQLAGGGLPPAAAVYALLPESNPCQPFDRLSAILQVRLSQAAIVLL